MNWSKLGRLLMHGPGIFFKQVSNAHFGTEYPSLASFDVTYRCPLRCEHCYFLKQNYQSELSDDEWMEIFRNLRKKGVKVAVWVGGEPLLRKDLVDRARKIFPFNWMITNGLIPLPDWKDFGFFVSVDGTKPYYEKIRGPHYEKLKENLLLSPVGYRIGMVISKTNYSCVEEFTKEWMEDDKCIAINYDFYTPSVGEGNKLVLDGEGYTKTVQLLRQLLEKYKDRILLSKKMLDLHEDPAKRAKVTGKNCLVGKFVSLDPMGKRKKPCILVGSDCTRCGRTVPFVYASIFKYVDSPSIWKLLRKVIP